MASLTEQLLQKMGIRDEPHVLEKTTELVRLLELRSSSSRMQTNEYGKIVLCAHLAADLLDIPIDTEQALKLSTMRKSVYLNNKRMFEKLLDLTKVIGIKDICIQLGVEGVQSKAQELLELYKKVIVAQNTEIDIEHPQYATMAVFYACKLNKQKMPKTKLMPFSNLRPQQFQQMEQRWEKFVNEHYNSAMTNKISQNKKIASEQLAKEEAQKPLEKEIVSETYEKWKQRILAMAQQQLATQRC